jgi:hypothetical protein
MKTPSGSIRPGKTLMFHPLKKDTVELIPPEGAWSSRVVP